MPFHRYREHQILGTELNPFDDLVDWLEGLRSVSHLGRILRETRALSEDEARHRARRGTFFAGIAVDFVEAARTSRPHVAFLPAYYAVLNMAKLMIACTDRSSAVSGAILHGVSYPVSQKRSQSLFTEILHIQQGGVFPLLYQVLTGQTVPIRKGKKGERRRTIALRTVYDRLFDVGAEYGRCEGVRRCCYCAIRNYYKENVTPAGAANQSFRLNAEIVYSDHTAIEADQLVIGTTTGNTIGTNEGNTGG